MRDFRDAKAIAQALREALNAKSISLTHSESLELVAKILGFRDWNVLAAKIQAARRPPATEPSTALQETIGAGIPTVLLRDIVLFPQMLTPLFVGRDITKRAVAFAMAADKRIFAVAQRNAADDSPALDAVYRVGATAIVLQHVTLPDGTVKLIVQGLERAAIVRFIEGDFLATETGTVEESRGQSEEALTLSRAVFEGYQDYANVNLVSPPQAIVRLPYISEPGTLADAVAPLLSIGIDQRQDLLETGDVIARLRKILHLIKTDRKAA
jgi:ATP-dependent Lon protease